ncbi:porin, partial [Paraburkholderia sp. C35]|uniref:porin n=2 Tax=Burkholderiaceae TaxID=119060 RepID=UPI000D6908FA
MKRRYPEVKAALAGAAMLATLPAFAQSSVTLYGIIDNGIGYQSSSTSLGSTTGGHSAFKMVTGVWAGSRFGLKGAEDLGGGTKAIFTLEEGFSANSGAMSTSGLMFSRQAFVGVSNNTYGSLTAGRQYAAYYQLLSPYSPTTWLTGFYGAHAGDLDGLDTIYRANNTLLYMSPTLYGFKFSGSYSFAGVPGSAYAGSTWSTAIQYAQGPIGIAVGFSKINNSNVNGGTFGTDTTTSNAGAQAGISAVTNGYQSARAQQRFAVGAGYTFNSQFDITATYSNV